MELNTIDDLFTLIDKEDANPLIIFGKYKNGTPEIEIYDNYRE